MKDTVINTALMRVAKAGDGGSTILGTLVTLLLAEEDRLGPRIQDLLKPGYAGRA